MRYPDVKFEDRGNSITIFPQSADGFEVSLYVDKNRDDPFEVYFSGWHESFSDPSEALECFAFGLSYECRLKEHYRGESAYRWTVEHLQDGSWEEYGTTGLIFSRFWRSKTVKIKQNRLITSGSGNE